MTPKTLKGDENMSANKIKAKEYIYIYIPQRRNSSEIEYKMQK